MHAGRILQETTRCQLPEGADDQETRVAGRRDYGAATAAAGPEVDEHPTHEPVQYVRYVEYHKATPRGGQPTFTADKEQLDVRDGVLQVSRRRRACRALRVLPPRCLP